MDTQYEIIPEFRIYNRYQELERREKEKKEQQWENELLRAMDASDPLANNHSHEKQLQTCRSCPKLNQNPPKSNSKMKKLKSCDSEVFNCEVRTVNLTDTKKTNNEQNLLSFCVSCSKTEEEIGAEEVKSDMLTCDIDKKLQSLDFIDRTPSPIDKKFLH